MEVCLIINLCQIRVVPVSVVTVELVFCLRDWFSIFFFLLLFFSLSIECNQ